MEQVQYRLPLTGRVINIDENGLVLGLDIRPVDLEKVLSELFPKLEIRIKGMLLVSIDFGNKSAVYEITASKNIHDTIKGLLLHSTNLDNLDTRESDHILGRSKEKSKKLTFDPSIPKERIPKNVVLDKRRNNKR